MRTPYGLGNHRKLHGLQGEPGGLFLPLFHARAAAVDASSHHTVMPAGALLFVEGQTPRGMFLLCSGKVKLSQPQKKAKC